MTSNSSNFGLIFKLSSDIDDKYDKSDGWKSSIFYQNTFKQASCVIFCSLLPILATQLVALAANGGWNNYWYTSLPVQMILHVAMFIFFVSFYWSGQQCQITKYMLRLISKA
jgi:hypothetical protein